MKDNIRLAVVNFEAIWGDKTENIRRMTQYLYEAAEHHCDFVVFPELAINGYSAGYLSEGEQIHLTLAEAFDGDTARYFAGLAKKLGLYLVYGMSEKVEGSGNKAYNTALFITPTGEIIPYRKIHPVEGQWCKAGKEPLLLDTPWGAFGLSVCYDTYAVPELERYYVANGARLLINPTASARGIDPVVKYRGFWEWYYRGRLEGIVAREGVFLVSANLVGYDGPWKAEGKYTAYFPGGSVILAPEGRQQVMVKAGGFNEEKKGLYFCDLDLSKVQTTPFLAGFRPDLYGQWYSQLSQHKMEREIIQKKPVIGVCDFPAVWGDREENIKRITGYLQENEEKEMDLLLFPEYSVTGAVPYPITQEIYQKIHEVSDTIPGQLTEQLVSLSEKYGRYLVVGMIERSGNDYYNTAVVSTPEGKWHKYRKIHLGEDEKNWCKAGSKPLYLNTSFGGLGICIHQDLEQAPELTRYYGGMGGVLLLQLTATKEKGAERRRCLERVADREGVYVASANLANEGFSGGSVVLDAGWQGANIHAGDLEHQTTGIYLSAPLPMEKKRFFVAGFAPERYSKWYQLLFKKK